MPQRATEARRDGAGFDGRPRVAALLLLGVSVCEPQRRHVDAMFAGTCWGALALTPTYGLISCRKRLQPRCLPRASCRRESSLKALPTTYANRGEGFDRRPRVAASLLAASVCEPLRRHVDPWRAGACWGALALTPTYGRDDGSWLQGACICRELASIPHSPIPRSRIPALKHPCCGRASRAACRAASLFP
jgi:hypothetical protein